MMGSRDCAPKPAIRRVTRRGILKERTRAVTAGMATRSLGSDDERGGVRAPIEPDERGDKSQRGTPSSIWKVSEYRSRHAYGRGTHDMYG